MKFSLTPAGVEGYFNGILFSYFPFLSSLEICFAKAGFLFPLLSSLQIASMGANINISPQGMRVN